MGINVYFNLITLRISGYQTYPDSEPIPQMTVPE